MLTGEFDEPEDEADVGSPRRRRRTTEQIHRRTAAAVAAVGPELRFLCFSDKLRGSELAREEAGTA
ncbi:hypothetical protein A245_41635, partial [Pseudomonas syringae pv. actinidiae ICMP 19096]